MEDPFPVGVAFDSNSKSVVFGFGRDPTIHIWEKQEQLLKRQFEMKIRGGGLGEKLYPSHKGYKTFFLVLEKKKGERMNEILKKHLGERHDTVIINSIKGKKLKNSFRPYFDEPCKQIILTFGKVNKDREKEPFHYAPRFELQDSEVTLELYDEILKYLFETIQKSGQNRALNINFENIIYEKEKRRFGKVKKDREKEPFHWAPRFELKDSEVTLELYNEIYDEILKDLLETIQKSGQNRALNINFENIIYEKEKRGLDSLSVVPEIKNEINIDLTEEEYLDSIKGIRFENIASKDDINAAKAEILKAIEEIAKKEHVELKNKTKEELANLSIILLKKIGDGI